MMPNLTKSQVSALVDIKGTTSSSKAIEYEELCKVVRDASQPGGEEGLEKINNENEMEQLEKIKEE